MEMRHEEERLKALKSYQIMDSAPEANFDEITKLAKDLCECPIALVSLIDDKRQWFKSHIGLDVQETSKSISFCVHTIHHNDFFEVPDAHLDERFKNNPLVTGGPLIRFYAGVPLKTPDGFNLGTLSVIGNDPHKLNDIQRRTLKVLSQQVIELLELRKKNHELGILNQKLEAQQELLINKARLQTIGELAGGVCHQINNPLAIIRGRSMILRHRLKENSFEVEKILSELDVIENTTDRVSAILKALRFYSKNMGEQKVSFGIHEALEDVILLLQPRIHKSGVILNFDKGPDISITANKNQIVQVLIDVISNALDSLEESDFRMLNLHSHVENKKVHLFISDTGKGISEENAPRIFDAFFSTRPRNFGVGLYNAKILLEDNGAEIKLLKAKNPVTFEIIF